MAQKSVILSRIVVFEQERLFSNRAQQVVLVGMILLTLAAQLNFILRSDLTYLATARLQDDSYYYLQPAWLFKQMGFFTFDGEMPTYGFQPLWMILLTIIAFFSSDKIAFLKESLLLGAVVYSLTGLLLYYLGRQWLSGWFALVLPALWLLNPPLIEVFVSGKENALYALLLVSLLLAYYRMLRFPDSIPIRIVFGIGCGMIVLARVNAIVFVLLLLVAVLWLPRQHNAKHARLFYEMVSAAAFICVLLPWSLYAYVNFGTLMPNSGTAKLIGATAALALFVNNMVPFIGMDTLANMLPSSDRIFLQAPASLKVPQLVDVLFYMSRFVPGLTLRFWGDVLTGMTWSAWQIVLMPFTRLCVVGFLISAAYSVRVRIQQVNRRQAMAALSRHVPIVALLIFALINGTLNGILLPSNIYYGTWYAVPEMLSIVVLVSLVALCASFDPLWREWRLRHPRLVVAAFLLVIAPVLLQFGVQTRPVLQSEPHANQMEKWDASLWLNSHVPSGTKVGAWNSGLLGYFANRYTVVNLDGLGNSPVFVDGVYRTGLLYARGLSHENALWNYIQQRNVRYIADLESQASFGADFFTGSVPLQNYEVAYQVQYLIDWGAGPMRMVVLRLHY